MNIVLMGSKTEFAEIITWCVRNSINILGIVCDAQNLDICKKYNVKVLQESDITDNIQWYKENTDFVISYLYWKILKEPIISMPKHGCINFHPAPLPDYKGLGGCSFAILNEEKVWGATAHFIDCRIDTGDIIEVSRFDFNWKIETAVSLKQKTLECQKQLFIKIMTEAMKNKALKSQEQDKSEGVYYSKKDMLNAMKIDFENDNIDKKIQAFWFPPYDGAYIEINGKKYTLVNDVVLNALKTSSN